MRDRDLGAYRDDLVGRRVTRRTVLRFGLLAAALPLAAACGQQAAPAPTAAPAKPAEAKPAEAPKPAAPAAQPAATKPAEAAKPAETKPAAPAVAKAKIDGKLTVVQTRDFHPDHNTFVEKVIKEWAEKQGYPLDHSYVEAYAGAGNVVQKLTAAVQAGDAPDVMTHTLRPSELKFLDIIEDVDSLQKELIADLGKTLPGLERRALLDGKWWAVQHFSRAGGAFVREPAFKEIGIDIRKDLDTMEKVRDAALKASKPDKEMWGWGLTANRSGDGETIVREAVMFSGGQLTDETGQVVVLNKDPFRQGGILGLTFLKETYTDPKWASMLPPGVNAWTDPSNNEAFLAGKILYTSNAGTMFAKAVVDKNPVADETYMIPRPKGVGPNARSLEGADGMRWFIMKGAKNREAAEQLIKHLHSRDVQREIFKISTGYAYPAYEWGWEEPMVKDDPLAQHVTPGWKSVAFNTSGYTAGEWPGPPTAWTASLESSNFWTDMFGEVLGGKSPEDALKSAHDRAVRVFKEFGAKGE